MAHHKQRNQAMTIPMLTDRELQNVIESGSLGDAVPAGVTVRAPITHSVRNDPLEKPIELPSDIARRRGIWLPSDGGPTQPNHRK